MYFHKSSLGFALVIYASRNYHTKHCKLQLFGPLGSVSFNTLSMCVLGCKQGFFNANKPKSFLCFMSSHQQCSAFIKPVASNC